MQYWTKLIEAIEEVESELADAEHEADSATVSGTDWLEDDDDLGAEAVAALENVVSLLEPLRAQLAKARRLLEKAQKANP